MLVKNIPNGSIIWYKESVIGIKGLTLDNTFDDCKCFACGGNEFDYELYEQTFTNKQNTILEAAIEEWAEGMIS